MSYGAHSKPYCSPYPRAPPRVTPLPFQYSYDLSDDSLPLYDRRPLAVAYHPSHVSLPVYQDFMETVDYRRCQLAKPPRCRSSFALSDISEEGEVENGLGEMSPSSPKSSSASSTPSVASSLPLSQRLKKAVFETKIFDFVVHIRAKCRRVGVRAIENDGTKTGLDLID
ncbi:hypothetical protein PHLCEN_2v2403 [Hermanssonia centrifuga]|uniref:Uncharacterized protein n=1 Tax=Hermanssonia centrifuga TaxID=98765 RepID=A0A2R6RM12_9APHY|nr:hypothetical protein PHLCEN_2v2403 [Hermanssonia centrifuga]